VPPFFLPGLLGGLESDRNASSIAHVYCERKKRTPRPAQGPNEASFTGVSMLVRMRLPCLR
jgi:hypothetical protein